MKTFALSRVILGACAVSLVTAGTAPAQPAPQPAADDGLLRVVQDEATIEKACAAYIKKKSNVEAEEHTAKNDKTDLYLAYVLEPEKAPKIKLVLDTLVSGRDEKNRVTERMVALTAYYILDDKAKTPKVRAALLELINKCNAADWMFGRVYLDEDGDVCLASQISIPGVPVHPEVVRDAIMRMVSIWGNVYPQLNKTLADNIPESGKPSVSEENGGDDDD